MTAAEGCCNARCERATGPAVGRASARRHLHEPSARTPCRPPATAESSTAAGARRSPCAARSSTPRPARGARTVAACPSARGSLEQVGHQHPFRIGQIGGVALARAGTVSRRVTVALRALRRAPGLGHAPLGHQPHDAGCTQRPTQRHAAHPRPARAMQLGGQLGQRGARTALDDLQQLGYVGRLQRRWPASSAARLALFIGLARLAHLCRLLTLSVHHRTC